VQLREKKSDSEWELIDFRLTSRLKSELTYLEVILLVYGCHISMNIKSTGSVVMVVLRDHNLFSGNRDFEHPSSVDLKGFCCAITHVISCQPMTAEAQIKSQGSHSTITNLTCDLYN